MPPLVRGLAAILGAVFALAAITSTVPAFGAVFGLAGAGLILAAIGRSPDTEGN